jgi:hypothetical protein
LLVVALVASIPATLAAPHTVHAQAPEFATSIRNEFPRRVVFALAASAGSEIVDVTLDYRIAGRGVSALGKPASFDAGTSIETEVLVETNSGNSYIPVGSRFDYSWALKLADGSTVTSEPGTFLYLPPDQQWESLENGIVRTWYYGDRAAIAGEYLEAGQETYQAMARDLFGIDLELLPVTVILFGDESELEQARPGTPGALDAAVVNCGTKVTSDVVFVIHRSCGTRDRTDTFRHEFTHIINEAAGEGPLGKLPSWLDEGTAVHGQSEPGDNYAASVDAALRTGRLIPFAQMGTASNDAAQVNLFYGQSWAMTGFLIDLGGPSEYARLFATIKAGARFDQALEDVYGFDLDGFEAAFYEAAGLAAPGQAGGSGSSPSQQQPTPVPTRPPLQTTTPTSNGSDDGIDPIVLGVVGASVLFALVAAFFYLWSLMLASKRKAAAAVPDEVDQWRPPPPPAPQ